MPPPTRSIDQILEIADPTAFAIALSDLVARSPRAFDDLRPAERVVWCISELEREVNNGGFALFFLNSAGDLAAETVAALETIGARHIAAVLREAMAVFPPPGPAPDREVRQREIDAMPETATVTWDRLDQGFFAYPDDLTGLLRAYVSARPEDFR